MLYLIQIYISRFPYFTLIKQKPLLDGISWMSKLRAMYLKISLDMDTQQSMDSGPPKRLRMSVEATGPGEVAAAVVGLSEGIIWWRRCGDMLGSFIRNMRQQAFSAKTDAFHFDRGGCIIIIIIPLYYTVSLLQELGITIYLNSLGFIVPPIQPV